MLITQVLAWWNFINTFGTGVHQPGVDELIRFWARSAHTSRVKVSVVMNCWYHAYVYFITSLTAKSPRFPLVDFHQTWYMDTPPWSRWTVLRILGEIRHRVQKFQCYLVYIFTSLTQNLKNPWVELGTGVHLPGVNELIRFGARSA